MRKDIMVFFSTKIKMAIYRLAIEKNKKHLKPVHTFHYLTDGHSILRKAYP